MKRSYTCHSLVQSLESRRLMSLTALGRDTVVPLANALGNDTAVSADGSFYLAGKVARSNSHGRIAAIDLFITHYGANGRQIGLPLLVSDQVDQYSDISISASASGTAAVAYVTSTGDTETVSYAVLTSGAITHQQAVYSLQNAGDTLTLTAVSMDNAGNFFIGWAEPSIVNNHDEYGDKLTIDHFSADRLNTPDQSIAAETPTSNDLFNIQELNLTARADGTGAVYTFQVSGSTNETGTFYNTRYGVIANGARTAGGTIASSGVNVLDEIHSGSAVVNSDNSFTLGYVKNTNGLGTAYAQRYSATGVAQGNPILLGHESDTVDLAPMPDSGFVAGTDIIKGGQAADILITRYNAAGVEDESGPTTIASTDSSFNLFGPVIGADSAGNVVASYQKYDPLTRLSTMHFRRLTSGVALDGNELYAIGTNENDSITVSNVGSRVAVDIDGVTQSVRANQVLALTIGGLAGNDHLINLTAIPSTIIGDAGNDYLYGGLANDVLEGGSGKDHLFGSDGADLLDGGAGNDVLDGDSGKDTLTSDAGTDQLNGGSGKNVVRSDTDDTVDR